MRRMSPVLVALLVASSRVSAQSPGHAPVFQSGVELVKLSASVSDKRENNFNTTLNKEDFQVFEDGAPQQLAIFTREQLPLSVTFLIDTSNSMAVKLPLAKIAAKNFIDTLRPQDMGQLISFADTYRIVEYFTSDHAKLYSAVEELEVNGNTALYIAMYIVLKEMHSDDPQHIRKHALILLSDGEDTAGESFITDDDASDMAIRSQVAVYCIALGFQTKEERTGATYHFLKKITEKTGGRLYTIAEPNELKDKYQVIAKELGTQYNLGYQSTNSLRDGMWRSIDVEVLNHPNLHVHSKPGYFAPKQ